MRRRNRLLLALALIVGAVTLPAYFFQYRFGEYKREGDVVYMGPAEGLLWGRVWGPPVRVPVGKPVTLTGTVGGKIISFKTQPFHEGIMGIFTRSGLPVWLGWVGGFFVPGFLIMGAAVLLLRKSNISTGIPPVTEVDTA